MPVRSSPDVGKGDDMFERMMEAHKLYSRSRVNGLVKIHPELGPLVDCMEARWIKVRRQALETAIDSLKHPSDVVKRKELYRHIASTQLPSMELVVGLRNWLLTHRSISKAQARELADQYRPRDPSHPSGLKQVEEEVMEAVVDQILADAEVLMDIAKGVGKVDGKVVDLPAEDRLDFGFMAVSMSDGSQKLVLFEIGVLRDVQRPCAAPACGILCSKRCGGCLTTFYCSSKCQIAHWNAAKDAHKHGCQSKHKEALNELRTIFTLDFQPVVLTTPAPKRTDPNASHAHRTTNGRSKTTRRPAPFTSDSHPTTST